MSLVHGPTVGLGLRRLLRSRKFLFALLISLLPALFGALMLVDAAEQERRSDDSARYYDAYRAEDQALLLLGGTIPLVALLLAGGMVADDVEDRTLSYLLVRPVSRARQYRSRLAAVALVVAGLGLLQAVLHAVFVGIEWATWYQDVPYLVEREHLGGGEYLDTTTASGGVILRLVLATLAAGPLVGAGLASLFGFVSLVTTRFHFLANLLLYGAWEFPFGVVAPAVGPGVLTVSYAATGLVRGVVPGSTDGVPAVWAVLLLLAWVAVWGTAGAQLMRSRDFTVTSARS